MSSQRELRKEKRVNQEDPINVTIIVDGIRKVIPWEEYILMPEYFPQPEEK